MSTRAAYNREPSKKSRRKLPRGAGYLPKWWLEEVPHSVLEDDTEHEKRITAIVLEQRQEHADDDVELLLRQSISSEDILQDLKDTEHSTSSLQYEVLPEEGTALKMKPVVVGSAAVVFRKDSPTAEGSPDQKGHDTEKTALSSSDSNNRAAFVADAVRVGNASGESITSTGDESSTFSTTNGKTLSQAVTTESTATVAAASAAQLPGKRNDPAIGQIDDDRAKGPEVVNHVSLVNTDECRSGLHVEETPGTDQSEPSGLKPPLLDDAGSPSFEQAWGQSTSDEERATPTNSNGGYDTNPFTVIRSSEEKIEVAVTFTDPHIEDERSTVVAGGYGSTGTYAVLTADEKQAQQDVEADEVVVEGEPLVGNTSSFVTDLDGGGIRCRGRDPNGIDNGPGIGQFSAEEREKTVIDCNEFERDSEDSGNSDSENPPNEWNGFHHLDEPQLPEDVNDGSGLGCAVVLAPQYDEGHSFEKENGEVPGTTGSARAQHSIYLPEEHEVVREHVGPENLRHVEFEPRRAPRDPTMVVGPHLLRRVGRKHGEDENETQTKREKWDQNNATIISSSSAYAGGDIYKTLSNNNSTDSRSNSNPNRRHGHENRTAEPEARRYRTAFTGVSPFDFAMQQRAKEKERKEKERLAKQALSRHHATSVQVDKILERKQKDLEERQRKMEAEKAMKTHHATSVQVDKAVEQRQKGLEERQKKMDAERALHAFRERELPDRKK